jgi:hypothetical protein
VRGRSLSTVVVEHPRSCISTQHHNMYESAGVDSLRSEPCGLEAPLSMHDTVCRLLRITLPRTPLNKGRMSWSLTRRLHAPARGLMLPVTRERNTVEALKPVPQLGHLLGRVEPVAQPATSRTVRRWLA